MPDIEHKLRRLEHAIPVLRDRLAACGLCGRCCGVDRRTAVATYCVPKSPLPPDRVRLGSHTLHFGEEPMIVGKGGSGTVFFTHCNLRCVFCQNYQISQEGLGDVCSYEELAAVFLELQARGAENINLVTPTHFMYPILLAFHKAYNEGLRLPIVYNTNGYDSVELLTLLDGIVDVYLPDVKYMDDAVAERYSGGKRYVETAQAAIKEMYRQTGPLQVEGETAVRGLLIRHLVLPGNLSGSYDFLIWLKAEGLLDITLALMSQYAPRHRAQEYEVLRLSLIHI